MQSKSMNSNDFKFFGGPLICYTTYTFEFIGTHLKSFEVNVIRLHATGLVVDGER